jgi:uncharacterized OB-fold protein
MSDSATTDAWPEVLCRVPPDVNELTEFFWKGGTDGVLRILGCNACGRLIHPPTPRCPYCHSENVAPRPVSGRGTVYSHTVNEQQWVPGQQPFSIALVALEEDETVRLTTNVIRCAPYAVYIGMPVEVEFVAWEDFLLPCFRPTEGADLELTA